MVARVFGLFLFWREIVRQFVKHEVDGYIFAVNLNESDKLVEDFQRRCVVREIIEPQKHIVNRWFERFRLLCNAQAGF
ncbi:hypothetical protein [Adlercreutzia equolifaciens]|uniref:hypothetical protein n=1 Tax=Adlercreutzia equolifaciens TaxID=446660 RepID=UPI00399C8220